MKLFTLSCQHCGAPLEVPARISLFKCLCCASQLHVQWVDSIAHAEEFEDSAPAASHLIRTPEQHAIEEEIALLDDAWRLIRTRFMVPGHDGLLSVPVKEKTLISCGIGVLFGCAALATGIAIGLNDILRYPGSLLLGRTMMLLGVLMIIVVVIWSRIAFRKSVEFEVHQQAYQTERSRLLAEFRNLPYAVADPR